MLTRIARKSQRFYSTRRNYTIPQCYRDAFFLANAPLFDYTNWFIHSAYEVCFSELVDRLLENDASLDENLAREKVHKIIGCLEPCNSVIDINFPVRRSDGNYEVVRGFRAVHGLNLYDTPCLGGMRICSDLNKDHVRAFSVLSTYKLACMGIQMSGAHGGLKISGYGYDAGELKAVVETYGRELSKRGFLGSQVDIVEPDLYCGSREMAWIAAEFAKNMGSNEGVSCAVGKPISCGGIKNYDGSLGEGVILALEQFVGNEDIMGEIDWEGDLKGKTFIVQGLGRIGSQIAMEMTNAGAICVGVKEHDAFVYMPEGVPMQDLLSYKEDNGTILQFNKFTKSTVSDQIFTQPCDVLILAATHRSLLCFVAERVEAKIIVEAAYAPMTPTAHKVLLGRRRLVLPDIFAGSGATITSYLEYVKNLQHARYDILVSRLSIDSLSSTNPVGDADDDLSVTNMLERIMTVSYNEVVGVLTKYNLGLDVRTACYINAINKIFKRILDSKAY